MTHRAQQITDYLIKEVLSDLPSTGSNVFYERVVSLTDDEVPALTVKRGSDVAIGDRGRLNNGRIDRYIDISIGIGHKAQSNLHQQLNESLIEVYEAMMSSLILSDLPFVVDFWHSEDSEPDLSGDAEKPIGVQESNWVFHYSHSIGSPAE